VETPFIILGQFLILGVVSIGMGVVFGFGTALLFKHLRFLTVSPVTEMFIMFGFSMICYFTTSLIVILNTEMSGIISILVCSIINGHYTFYNFSPQGKATSSVTVSFLGMMFEAAIYAYIGIALYATIPTWWSW
jgi:NhaP-type Na+/H+ or K+/H+ antiporter